MPPGTGAPARPRPPSAHRARELHPQIPERKARGPPPGGTRMGGAEGEPRGGTQLSGFPGATENLGAAPAGLPVTPPRRSLRWLPTPGGQTPTVAQELLLLFQTKECPGTPSPSPSPLPAVGVREVPFWPAGALPLTRSIQTPLTMCAPVHALSFLSPDQVRGLPRLQHPMETRGGGRLLGMRRRWEPEKRGGLLTPPFQTAAPPDIITEHLLWTRSLQTSIQTGVPGEQAWQPSPGGRR